MKNIFKKLKEIFNPKENKKPIIILSAAVVVVIVLILLLCLGRGGTNTNEPAETKTVETVVPETTAPVTTEKPETVQTEPSTTEPVETEPKECVHEYKDEVVAPTCEKEGYTLHTCTKCKESFKDNKTESTGHNWQFNYFPVVPTCTEKGTAEYICSVCQKTEQREYTLNDSELERGEWHSYQFVQHVGNDSTEDSYDLYKCERCGREAWENFKEGVPAVTPQTPQNPQTPTTGTTNCYIDTGWDCGNCYRSTTKCIEEKIDYFKDESLHGLAKLWTIKCPLCGYTEYDVVKECYDNGAPHTFTDWQVVSTASKTSNRIEQRYCTVCGWAERVETTVDGISNGGCSKSSPTTRSNINDFYKRKAFGYAFPSNKYLDTDTIGATVDITDNRKNVSFNMESSAHAEGENVVVTWKDANGKLTEVSLPTDDDNAYHLYEQEVTINADGSYNVETYYYIGDFGGSGKPKIYR